MATVVFVLEGITSHLNASFRIARLLADRGHAIVYIGGEPIRGTVDFQGYRFELIPLDPVLESSSNVPGDIDFLSFSFRRYITARRRRKKLNHLFLETDLVESFLERLKPDLVILDFIHLYHAFALVKHGIPTVSFQTMVSLNRDPRIPPVTSGLIPSATRSGELLVRLSWTGYFLKAWWLRWSRMLISLGLSDQYHLGKKLARKHGFRSDDINFDRTFHFGLKSIPELVLCPREFDYPRQPRENEYYLGPLVDLDRKEPPFDWGEIANSRRIVYCSLGTLSKFHYGGCEKFFRKVIDVFRKRADCHLILSTGGDIDPAVFDPAPSNVHVHEFVPQIQVLKRARFMITHGGINTIKECILLGVPMVVYPLNALWDQHGNSARVVYHGMGLRGNIRKDSEKQIGAKVDRMLADRSFGEKVGRMQEKFLEQANPAKLVELIESFFTGNTE